jgi:hypothetical protein
MPARSADAVVELFERACGARHGDDVMGGGQRPGYCSTQAAGRAGDKGEGGVMRVCHGVQIPSSRERIKDNRLTFDTLRRKSPAERDKGGTRDARTNTDTGRYRP